MPQLSQIFINEALDIALKNEYFELMRNKVAYHRIETGELDIFGKDTLLTPDQKKESIKKHLKTITESIKKFEKTITAIEAYRKTITPKKK